MYRVIMFLLLVMFVGTAVMFWSFLDGFGFPVYHLDLNDYYKLLRWGQL